MDSFGVPAPKMDWESANLPEAWRRFRQHAELIFSGPLREKREQDKCSYLLLWIGEKGRDIFNTWTLTDEDAKKLQTYYDKYTAYLTPKSNPIYARYRFHEKMQGDGETFEQFVTELKLLVKDCGYPNSDEMVRDRIVFATNSPRVREKLLSHAELNLVSRMTSYIDSHFGSLMESQSWELETSVSKITLRSALLEMACSLNRLNCTTQAKQLFDQWVHSNKTSPIPSDLMRTVFKVAAQTDDGWDVLLNTYKHSIYDSEKHKTLEGLASTQDVRKILWIMKKSLDGSEIQTQDFPLVIHTICRNFAGYLYAWDFVKENWEKITQKFPLGSFPIQSIIMSTTSQFSTKTHLMEAQNFFSSLGAKGSQMRIVQEATETIKQNMRWMENNLSTLRYWL